MSNSISKPVKRNTRQGGSYSKDVKSGDLALIEQTTHQEITGFEQQVKTVAENTPATTTAKANKNSTKEAS